MYSVSVCAPAYNEEAGIEKVLQNWIFSLEKGIKKTTITDYEIVLCDDGSTDETIKCVNKIKNDRIKVVQNPSNQGPGIAIRRAIQASSNEFVITIDSDGQFNLGDALEWLNTAKKDAIVLGYREKADSFLFKIGTRISNKVFNFITLERIPDSNCMLKLLPGNLARSLDLRAVGLNYSGEMTFIICTSPLKAEWRPVTHLKRTSGKSSAKFLRDGIKRLKFQLFLVIEHNLIQNNILTKRNSL